jgi:hypothetical protein
MALFTAGATGIVFLGKKIKKGPLFLQVLLRTLGGNDRK